MLITPARRRRRASTPKAPHELQDVVEVYARETGRTGKIHFAPGAGWFARFSLRPNDKRMKLFREGKAEEPPTEDVWFHVAAKDFRPDHHTPIPGMEPGRGKRKREFVPLDILQMGATGLREFLEKGNTWSGRGAFDSHVDAFEQSQEKNREARRKLKRNKRQDARDRAEDRRRQVLGIPYLGIDIDLQDNHGEEAKIVTPSEAKRDLEGTKP